MSEGTSRQARSRVIRRILASVVLVEGISTLAYGGYLTVETLVATATERGAAVALTLFALTVAVTLCVLSWFALRGRRAVRAPIVVWQILQASVGFGVSLPLYAAAPMVILSAIAIVAVFLPGVIRESDQPE